MYSSNVRVFNYMPIYLYIINNHCTFLHHVLKPVITMEMSETYQPIKYK